jgi:Bacterial Ig-like domain (group 1)
MRKFASIIALFGLTLALAGCGGDSGCGALSGGTSSGSSSGATTCSGKGTTTNTTPAKVAVSTSAATIPPDGSAPATITATVVNSSGTAVSGVTVTFGATAGTLSAPTGTTNASGVATTTLTASGVATGTSITVTATAGTVSGTTVVGVGTSGKTGVTSLTAMTSATSILSDGSTTAIITVLARDVNNNLMSGVDVSFAATSGGLAVTQATTDATGAATATLSTAGDSTLRTITVTATSGTLTATAQVQVVASSSASTTTVSSLVVTSSTAYILSDGSTTATISALARDAANNAVSGVPVTFSASSGALQVVTGTTGATGAATATLTTGGDSTVRTITVTGTTATLSSTVQVNVQAPSVYTMGNGTGTNFQSGAIGLTTSGTLAAGGTVGLTVTIVDQNDTLYTGGPVTVTFNSPCVASGNAQILPSGSSTPSNTITTSTGSLGATYVAKGCSGSDTVTATATIGSGSTAQNVSATTTLTIGAATSGSIQFVSASPISIGLKGTGLNETSTVIFKVLDTTGGAKSGVTVNFALDSTVGGLSLSPMSAVSASDGTVQTVVGSGTVHTVVRVTASITSPALSTQSSQLTVTTGLPASKAFTIGVGPATYANLTSTLACPNVEAWSINGVSVPFTVALADRYNNPVPGGTAVTFYTNGGHIVGSCTTPTLAGTAADGTCSAIWTSANPRPTNYSSTAGGPNPTNPPVLLDGRAQVFATVIGEESFTDSFGTGFYQSPDVFDNLGEPYLDANESGAYLLGDHYLDFNNNGTRDGPSGSFVGISCTGSSATSTCSTSTLALGVSQLVIMSTSLANITPVTTAPLQPTGFTGTVTSGLSIKAGSSGTVTFNVQDTNGNSMAAGSAVSGIADASVGSATPEGGNIAVGCNADVGGQNYTISFSAITTLPTGTTSVSGSFGIKIVSPSGSITTLSVPVTVD